MRRSIKIAAALTFVTAVFVTASGGHGLLLIPLTLAIGWVKSTGRFVSVVQLSAATVVWSIVIVGVLLVGTHTFCAWVRQAQSSTSSPWKWRWTCSFYCALVLVLFASASLVGIAHQTGWMIGSKEPFFKRRWDLAERMRLRNVAGSVLELARTNQWDFVRVKRELVKLPSGSNWESFAFYLVGESNGAPDRLILFRRNPKYQTEIGIVERDNFHTRPFRDLAELLRSPP
jgi:hypothetical protein